MTRQVQILAFDGMEVLDYAGPYEVFNVAGELGDGAFTVTSVGVTASPTGRGGFAVVPAFKLEDAPCGHRRHPGWTGDTRAHAGRADAGVGPGSRDHG